MSDPELSAALAAIAYARERDPILRNIHALLDTARRELKSLEPLTEIEQETLSWISAAITTLARQPSLLQTLKAAATQPPPET